MRPDAGATVAREPRKAVANPIGAAHSHHRPYAAAWSTPLAPSAGPQTDGNASSTLLSARKYQGRSANETTPSTSAAATARPSRATFAFMRGVRGGYCFSAGSQCSAILPFSSLNMSNQVVLYFWFGSFGSAYSRAKLSTT